MLCVCVQVDNTMFNISYEATLVAGQIGFSLHEESTPVVEPFAGWAMLTTQDTHTAVRNHIQVRGSPGSRLRLSCKSLFKSTSFSLSISN